MSKEQKETISTRVISTLFIVLALAIFKPFGLEAWKWYAYFHLLVILLLGFASCFVTEVILKYIIKMPRSHEKGVGYIIKRNLRFQIINTLLVTLVICLYRHFAMSDLVESNKFSVSNFLETLLIIAFLSFTIGLYWRFKYRSRFLSAELEETRLLNEQLSQLRSQPTAKDTASSFTLTGTTNETVTLLIPDLLYIETVGNYVKVFHLQEGKVRNDMLRATSKQMEDELKPYSMIVRCHRAFLVNLEQVDHIMSRAGTMQLIIKNSNESIPVSRSNMTQIKQAISKA